MTKPTKTEASKARDRLQQRQRWGIRDATAELKSGPCDICQNPTECLHMEHNHATGMRRGWVCYRCNSVLGYFKDSPERLNKAITYLARTDSGMPA